MSAPHDPSEANLLVRLRDGEADAYEQLIREQGQQMLRVARRLMRDESDARDVVQDAFLSAFRGMDRFQGHARLGTWLHRIVVNACLMRLRQRSRTEVSIDEFLPQFEEDGHRRNVRPAWYQPAEFTLQSQENRRLVRESIDRLPETYRTVLLMRDIEELNTDEVASLLGVTHNAVKIRLHRARQALREILDPHFAARPGDAAPV